MDGNAVPQDYIAAATWFRKAAEQGEAKAQVGLGFIYFSGLGVAEDYSEALKWFLKAQEQGNADAQATLELCMPSAKVFRKTMLRR
jgi:uncharacterized protein